MNMPQVLCIITVNQAANGGKEMKHIKTIMAKTIKGAGKTGCGECQASCQSACKTSCTVANQPCRNEK